MQILPSLSDYWNAEQNLFWVLLFSTFGLVLTFHMSASPANHSAVYAYVAICIAASLIILLLPAVFFFKIYLILGYRTLTAHFYKKGEIFYFFV